MYFVDYHVHTEFSSDGQGKMEEAVSAAIDNNIKEIAITDHLDIDYPPVSYQFFEEFDYDKYTAEIEALRRQYGNKIRIVKGVEITLQTRAKKRIEAFLEGKCFDFIIGSTHVVDYMDLYEGNYFDGKQKLEAVRRYFEDIYRCVGGLDMYNVYGHLDAVTRYGPYPDRSLDFNEYKGIIDEILKLLIKKGKGIELNASGFRYGLAKPHPSREILERYRELGGEIITVGSDAHRASDVADSVETLYDMLKSVGFSAVTTFSEGKPTFVDI